MASAQIRRALAALFVTACVIVIGAVAASADPMGFAPDPGNSVVVSRLSISDGRGWLTLHARNNTAIGYEVRIPAGNGSWGGKADVYAPEMDAHCRLQPGPDLHYICRPGQYGFPSGNHAVSIPVTRTGSVEGLKGRSWAFADNSYGWYGDTFPVLDASHHRSTAEVRNAPVEQTSELWVGDHEVPQTRAYLAVTTTIVPGESITALDSTLPANAAGGRIVYSNAGAHGVRCSVLASDTSSPTLHCVPSSATATSLPRGRYNLVVTVHYTGYPPGNSTWGEVSLTQAGFPSETQDSFVWASPWRHPYF